MNRKYRKRKLPKYFFIISLALFLFVGIGYSVINSNLTMQGNVVRKATSWSIGFSNPVFDTGSKTSPTPTITNGTTMTMNVNLTNPGDIYAFTVDLTNNGSVPALINTLNITELTEEQKVYLRWKVEYEDESSLAVGDLLKAGETKKVHIYLEYKKLRATDLYPSSNVNINLTVQANFYLPEETFNTVTITKNGSTKLVQVSNLEQETTLDDFPIETADKVIACNNGVEPSTDTNNKIVLSKVKQDATCRIETSLASAVTNCGTVDSNLTLLNDDTNTSKITIGETQIINIDINGKTSYYNVASEYAYITNSGKLAIKDTKGTGKIQSLRRTILCNNNSSSLTIKSSTIERVGDGSGAGYALKLDGNVYIKNSIIKTTDSWTMGFNNNSSANVIIDSSKIVSSSCSFNTLADNTLCGNITIKNSEISPYISNATNGRVNIYLCNNVFKKSNTENDFHEIRSKNNYIYYSNNNIFISGNNNPSIAQPNSNFIRSDIACAE